jgi:glycosyltransferase involved in cell wall biosynthesis
MTTQNNDIFNFDIKFWVFIPVYNFEEYLNECCYSLFNQTYKNYNVVFINDGSTDSSTKIIDDWALKFKANYKDCVLINLKENMGPAYTKWSAIKYVRESANKNDIFTILDGDDSYSSLNALKIIHERYLKTKCWFTYGSALGEYTDQGGAIDADCILNLRKPRGSFKYQHPRSCLVFLLDYMNENDFQDADGKWLLRLTDRQFIYKCLELSGLNRICFIEQKLYNYRTHANNVRNKLDNTYKFAVDTYINSLPPSLPIMESIHLVMCCYKRHHNLTKIINSVENQTVARRIVLHVINTNPDKWAETTYIKTHMALQNIKLTICNTNENLYGYARFLYTKQLLRKEIVPYIIFFDDDQVLPKHWVENIYRRAKPLSYCCWFGRIFKKNLLKEKMSYWDDKINSECRRLALYSSDIKTFDFGATCGCLVDTNIFRFDLLFKCPKQYRNIEDLWLSFIVRQVLGNNISPFNIPIDCDTFDDTEQTALWVSLYKEKQVFLNLLVDIGFLRSSHINIGRLNDLVEKEDDSEKYISKFVYE